MVVFVEHGQFTDSPNKNLNSRGSIFSSGPLLSMRTNRKRVEKSVYLEAERIRSCHPGLDDGNNGCQVGQGVSVSSARGCRAGCGRRACGCGGRRGVCVSSQEFEVDGGRESVEEHVELVCNRVDLFERAAECGGGAWLGVEEKGGERRERRRQRRIQIVKAESKDMGLAHDGKRKKSGIFYGRLSQ